MTVETILKLHEIGYTKEEIMALETGAAPADPAPADPAPADPKPDPAPAPAEPSPDPKIADLNSQIEELRKQLKTAQAAAAAGAKQPEDHKPLSAEDVITSFIKGM